MMFLIVTIALSVSSIEQQQLTAKLPFGGEWTCNIAKDYVTNIRGFEVKLNETVQQALIIRAHCE